MEQNIKSLLEYIDKEIYEAELKNIELSKKFRVPVNGEWTIRIRTLEDVRNQVILLKNKHE